MTADKVAGIVRAVAGVALGYIAGKGIIPAGMVADLTAALGTIAIAIWSVTAKKAA